MKMNQALLPPISRNLDLPKAKPRFPEHPSITRGKIRLSLATAQERETIYRLRHEVYALELGQHAENSEARLKDPLDLFNTYLIASIDRDIVGFISITPPGHGAYSIDKYLEREQLPFDFDHTLYEVRLLTVIKPHRGQQIAALLMYAAFRWVEAHGGTRIVAIGRRDILDLYLKAGLQPAGLSVQSGRVIYDVLQTGVMELRERLAKYQVIFQRLEPQIDWQLSFSFQKPAPCFHGGAFFKAIGETFAGFHTRHAVINADVLDAWFPPSPTVIAALGADLPWLLQTSPPTACEGLIQTIAQTRGIEPGCILPGAGSSDLIFRALPEWLSRSSRALLLDPTYGEYGHVLEQVIRCSIERLVLSPENGYEVDLNQLETKMAENYDLVVIVNPNSPTGRHIPRKSLESILRRAPYHTKIWIDETYIDYAGAGQTLERFATETENVIVCKSMSKVYALSGARAAYLCASPALLEGLRAITPPWVVSLPGQVAAVKALQDPDYYAWRYAQTHVYREQLAGGLKSLNLQVVPGMANFLLAHLPPSGPDARTVVQGCRQRNLFLRDASAMGAPLGDRAIRIAVKDAATNARMLQILSEVLEGNS